MPARRGITARFVVLQIHLYLGLTAALFLIILSLTGTVMAFEHDIERWTQPRLWRATPGQRTLPEAELVRISEEAFPPARVAAVQIDRRPDLVQVMQMTDNASVYISPWDGAIHGRIVGSSKTQKIIGYIHQLHLRLVPDPRAAPRMISVVGKIVISLAGLMLCLLVPTGMVLWWRAKRSSINWSASWFRICFDTHQTIGIYASLFLMVAAFTGVMVGFDFAEETIYSVTHSDHPNRLRPPQSGEPAGRFPITIDRATESAHNAFPGVPVIQVQLPLNPKAVFSVQLGTPGDPSVDSPIFTTVFVDQYSAEAIHVQNLFGESPGYRMVRLNRAIHTGDILGLPGHILTSLSSLLLGVMAVTGILIWWKKRGWEGKPAGRKW